MLNNTPIGTAWHSENAIKIEHLYNGIPLEFYFKIAAPVPLKLGVTIYGSQLSFITNEENEIAENEDIYLATNNMINEHLSSLLIGEKVMAAPLFNLLNKLADYKVLSNFRIEVKREADQSEWHNDYDVVLKYYEMVGQHRLKIIHEQ